jgi:hypothetical protein
MALAARLLPAFAHVLELRARSAAVDVVPPSGARDHPKNPELQSVDQDE